MDSISTPFNFNRKNFLVQWILANLLGGAIIAIIGNVLLSIMQYVMILFHSDISIVLTIGWDFLVIIVGIFITGFAEQQILQHYLQVSGGWWLLTTLAGIYDMIIFLVISPLFYILMADQTVSGNIGITQKIGLTLLVIALLGFVIGIMQWSALRKIVRRAGHWIWINVVNSMLSLIGFFIPYGVIAYIFMIIHNYHATGFLTPFANLLAIGAAAAVNGAVTGFSLLWLLKRPAGIYLAKVSSPSLQDASTRLEKVG